MKNLNLYIDGKKIDYSKHSDNDKIFLYNIAKEVEDEYKG